MNSIRHTQEQLYATPKIGYVDCNAKFCSDTLLLHHRGTFSGDIHASPRNNQNQKLTVTTIVSILKQQTRLLLHYGKHISLSHIQQCLNLTMYFSLRHLAAKMLSQLYHDFISFPYLLPSYETSSIKYLHIKKIKKKPL